VLPAERLGACVDEQGRVAGVVNNYEHLSFDVGPTLLSWLEGHHPDVLERIVAADAGGAIAQAYNHSILPLATERDMKTQIRWGLADFTHRFGRERRRRCGCRRRRSTTTCCGPSSTRA
jgi:alpha-amylase/alpha-mannosidase (GH57 family)